MKETEVEHVPRGSEAGLRALGGGGVEQVVAAEHAVRRGRSGSGRTPSNVDSCRLLDASGRPIDLTPTEFDLLAMLVAQPNRTFNRAQLLAGLRAR